MICSDTVCKLISPIFTAILECWVQIMFIFNILPVGVTVCGVALVVRCHLCSTIQTAGVTDCQDFDHILRVLLLLILVLTADWPPCGDGCRRRGEGDTEEEQQEGDQEDQGELLLQVGQPAGLVKVEIINCIQNSVGTNVMVFYLPGDDGGRKEAHENPLAIEHCSC